MGNQARACNPWTSATPSARLDAMTMLSRRATTGLLIAGTLMPGAVLAQTKKKKRKRKKPLKHLPPPKYPALAAKLEERLNSGLGPGCKGKFTVPTFDYAKKGGETTMSVVVRLDWPPGWRQRPLAVTEADDQTAWEELVRISVAKFATPWPGCVT